MAARSPTAMLKKIKRGNDSLRATLLKLQPLAGVDGTFQRRERARRLGMTLVSVRWQGPRNVPSGQVLQWGGRGRGAERTVEGFQERHSLITRWNVFRGLGKSTKSEHRSHRR